jgi:hypothetical protein
VKAMAPNNKQPSGFSPSPSATDVPKIKPVRNGKTSFVKSVFFKISVSKKTSGFMEPASVFTSRALSLLPDSLLTESASFGDYPPKVENPPRIHEVGFCSWRLGVLGCLVNTWAVGVPYVFSDYKSDYVREGTSCRRLGSILFHE